MTSDEQALARFLQAQDRDRTYERALAELRAGRKRTHWMWFVFPQLAGLGASETARRYAISSLAEARAYLGHPVLGPRLRAAATVLLETADRQAEDVLGDLDALKLRSSMTLFARVAADPAPFRAVLDRHFAGVPDPLTERLLSQER